MFHIESSNNPNLDFLSKRTLLNILPWKGPGCDTTGLGSKTVATLRSWVKLNWNIAWMVIKIEGSIPTNNFRSYNLLHIEGYLSCNRIQTDLSKSSIFKESPDKMFQESLELRTSRTWVKGLSTLPICQNKISGSEDQLISVASNKINMTLEQ